MELKEYMREIYLMNNQYGQEEELYPLINILLRQTINDKTLSIRDIHNARTVKDNNTREALKGDGGFPDIVILSENFGSNDEYLNEKYGCIEAKTKLPSPKDITIDKDARNRTICFKESEVSINNIEQYWVKKGNAKFGEHNFPDEIVVEYCNDTVLIMPKSNSKKVNYYLEIPREKFGNCFIMGLKKEDKEWSFTVKKTTLNGITGLKHEDQLVGELLNYGKVIYTDGLTWLLLEIDKNKLEKENEIHFYGCVIGKLKSHESFKDIAGDSFEDKWKKIDDVEAYYKEWDTLMYNLSIINWTGQTEFEKFEEIKEG